MAQLGRFPRTIAHSIRIQNRTVWTLPKRENYKGGEGGDPIEVGAGEIVPVDGKVLKGSSYLNESVLNGESFPVKKQTGDSIYGGSENQSETLQKLIQRAHKV